MRLREEKYEQEADKLQQATVNWLRQTAIANDIKIRPREHVYADAGLSNNTAPL